MNPFLKSIISIIFIIAIGIGAYFYFIAPENGDNQVDNVTIVKRRLKEVQQPDSQNLDQILSGYENNLKFFKDNLISSQISEFNQNLTNF